MPQIEQKSSGFCYVTILDEKMIGKQKTYLVDYGGVKCTAVFNPFTGQYYADDIYGRIEE